MKQRTPEENREKARRHRERCRAEGLCFRCMSRLDCESVQFCRACLLRQREYRREYGGHKALKPDDVTAKKYGGDVGEPDPPLRPSDGPQAPTEDHELERP